MTPAAVVLDTNILFSALWSLRGAPAQVVRMAVAPNPQDRLLLPCFDRRIMAEYDDVLHRYDPGRKFSNVEADRLLGLLATYGRRVTAPPLPEASFQRDETDRPFYEVAVHCDAALITGNLKHYPDDPRVMKPDVFLERLAGATAP